MRRLISAFVGLGLQVAAAAAELGALSLPVGQALPADRKRNPAKGARSSIATGNRHGGPHLHLREKARRVRQGLAR